MRTLNIPASAGLDPGSISLLNFLGGSFLRHRCLSLILLGVSALPLAAQQHSLTFEDMMKLKRVEEPVPSPDGKWVLFAAVDVDLAANTKTPHVWIVPTAGGQEKEIISDQDADRPRWAPDGKRFAFVSTKHGGSQVWIADFDGDSGTVTETHKLTSMATEAGGELWSPDGKYILLTSDVYPECDGTPAEAAVCNARKLDEANKAQVKAKVFTRLLYRHWNAFKEGKRSHLFVVELPPPGRGLGGFSSDVPRDLTPGDFDSPVFSVGGQDNYAFSPDGQEICYTSNHDPVGATSTNNDLWIVPVSGGMAKNITADNKASDSTPLYSPDGKYIAYRVQARPGYESDRFRLMLFDRKSGEKRNLTENFDQWVGTYVWIGNSYGLLFSSESQGLAPVYYVGANELKGSKVGVSSVIQGFDDDLALTHSGELLFTKMSLRGPTEISHAHLIYGLGCTDPPPGTTCPTCGCETSVSEDNSQPGFNGQLTHLNDTVLSQVSMSPLETFWFAGALGDKVQGFLVRPPHFEASKKYPVKFLIHGGPEGAWGDEWSYRWNAELFAANGYVVIMINPHGSTGYGQKFTDAVNGDWGGAPFEDLMKGLDYAEKHYPFIDKDRECALGASYGGYMADWILGHTNRFKCVVSHDGTFNTESFWGTTEELWFPEWEFKGTPYTNRELYRKWSPHLYASNFKTPTLVIHSQEDYRLDVSEGFQLFTTLQRMGVPSKMLYFPDEGHWILKPQNSQLWYKAVNDWVDQWVGNKGN
jgi:dipeptidyl aminopeptidase/acylaminoacyl peptidase